MQKESGNGKEYGDKDKRRCLYPDGYKGRAETTAYKPFGMQKKDKKEFVFDGKEQQVCLYEKYIIG